MLLIRLLKPVMTITKFQETDALRPFILSKAIPAQVIHQIVLLPVEMVEEFHLNNVTMETLLQTMVAQIVKLILDLLVQEQNLMFVPHFVETARNLQMKNVTMQMIQIMMDATNVS